VTNKRRRRRRMMSGSQQRRHRTDEMSGACRGLRSWHAWRETPKNLGDPRRPPETGKGRSTKGRPTDSDMGVRSFHSTRRRESRPQGEGNDRDAQPAKET
jgi:hypothetical protein